MRRIASLFVVSFLAALVPSPSAAEEPGLLTLREAIEQGLVTARGVEPGSYKQVTLELSNRTDRRLTLDLCGSFLHPKKKGSRQRLGLGPAVTPGVTTKKGPGTIVVSLEPEGELSLRMNTVCLDAGRPGPDSATVYEGNDDTLPAVREKVMRWWADHPQAPQSAVNTAIWHDDDEVRIQPGRTADYRRPSGLFPKLRGGTLYRLADGELSSIDPDGLRRVLGAEIFNVLPSPNGLYAVGLSHEGDPQLWRLALTGDDPWQRLFTFDSRLRLLRVLKGGAHLLLLTDQGVLWRDPSTGTARNVFGGRQIVDLSARALDENRFLVALRVPAKQPYYQGGERHGETQDVFELWTLDVRRGLPEKVKSFWNVSQMMCGPAGVYALSHAGTLRKLVGKNFRDVRDGITHDRILAVGRNVLWLMDAEGHVAALDAKTGAEVLALPEPLAGDTVIVMDPVTDDLAWVSGADFLRLRLEGGEIEKIE